MSSNDEEGEEGEEGEILQMTELSNVYVQIPTYLFDETTILCISCEENKDILNSLYDIWQLYISVQDRTVHSETNRVFDEEDMHPSMRLSYDKLHASISNIYIRVKSLTMISFINDSHYKLRRNLRGLRAALIELISVYVVFIPEYMPIFKAFTAILRQIFIKIVIEEIEILDKAIIGESVQNGNNLIRVLSDTEQKSHVNLIYVSKTSKVMKVRAELPKIRYLVDVKNNLCDCPDFFYRRFQRGQLCKHLLQLKNKTRCMMNIMEIMRDRTHNLLYPIGEMLRVAYDEKINYT